MGKKQQSKVVVSPPTPALCEELNFIFERMQRGHGEVIGGILPSGSLTGEESGELRDCGPVLVLEARLGLDEDHKETKTGEGD